MHLGWNEIDYTAHGRGIQFYGHKEGDWIDKVYVHNNYIHDTSMQGMIFSGEGGAYDYAFCKNVYIYNNIIKTSGNNTTLQLVGQYGNGKYGGRFFVYNNIFDGSELEGHPTLLVGEDLDFLELKNNIILGVENYHGYYTHFPGSAPKKELVDGDHNIYFGAGAAGKPVWDDSELDDVDPLFISATPHSYAGYQVQPDSPAIGQGTGDTEFAVVTDFLGESRGIPPSIGAFESAEYGVEGSSSTLLFKLPSIVRPEKE